MTGVQWSVLSLSPNLFETLCTNCSIQILDEAVNLGVYVALGLLFLNKSKIGAVIAIYEKFSFYK